MTAEKENTMRIKKREKKVAENRATFKKSNIKREKGNVKLAKAISTKRVVKEWRAETPAYKNIMAPKGRQRKMQRFINQ